MEHIDFLTHLTHEELRARPYGGSMGSLFASDPDSEGVYFYTLRASDDVYAGLLQDPDITVLHGDDIPDSRHTRHLKIDKKRDLKSHIYARNPHPRFHPHHH